MTVVRLSAVAPAAFTPQEIFLVSISVRGLVDQVDINTYRKTRVHIFDIYCKKYAHLDAGCSVKKLNGHFQGCRFEVYYDRIPLRYNFC